MINWESICSQGRLTVFMFHQMLLHSHGSMLSAQTQWQGRAAPPDRPTPSVLMVMVMLPPPTCCFCSDSDGAVSNCSNEDLKSTMA